MQKSLVANRPLGIKATVAALGLLATISISGGEILLADPSGMSMGIQSIAAYLPFNLQDFSLVGYWLIGVFGILPVILATGLWFGKKWAWRGSLSLGAMLVVWILAEAILFYSFGFVFFYPLIGGIGVLIIVILSLKSTKRQFES